uniref:Uncharacterized protein n=1 Tax=Meloidogyne enterolobii TaxID=390850 RepID=A0A6V7V6P3_MELEN|nr:unnamed protein product [Meloidogyne enterolobii]
MDSKSNLTQTNMTRNTSLTSIESGFVSLNEPKTKEAMTVEIDLICKMEEEKDAGIISKSWKDSKYGKDLVEKTNGFVKKSWRCTTNCFSSINKDNLVFLLKKIFAATLLIFVFVQGLVTFYLTFTNFVLHSENSSLDFSKLFGFIVTLIYSLFFYFYFVFVHKIFLVVHPSLKSSKCFSTLFKIVSGIFVFIIAFFSLLIIYSFFHFNIITFTLQNTFNNQVRIFMAIFSWAGLFCQLYLYFSFFKKILENFPLTMDPIFKFFKLEIEIG